MNTAKVTRDVATLVGDKGCARVYRTARGTALIRWTTRVDTKSGRVVEVKRLELKNVELALDTARKIAQTGDPWA